MRHATITFIFRGDEVLLAMKKQGFGAGKWNGSGGKVEPGETPRQGAHRGVFEEVGVRPELDEPLGEIFYHDSPKGDWTVKIFCTIDFTGQPVETEEMRPQWFQFNAVPFNAMWPSDSKWMLFVLEDKKLHAKYWFNGQDQLINAQVEFDKD